MFKDVFIFKMDLVGHWLPGGHQGTGDLRMHRRSMPALHDELCGLLPPAFTPRCSWYTLSRPPWWVSSPGYFKGLFKHLYPCD